MKSFILIALCVLSLRALAYETVADQVGAVLEFKTYHGNGVAGGHCMIGVSQDFTGGVQIRASLGRTVKTLKFESSSFGHVFTGQRLFRWQGGGHFLTRMVSEEVQFFAVEDASGVIECETQI